MTRLALVVGCALLLAAAPAHAGKKKRAKTLPTPAAAASPSPSTTTEPPAEPDTASETTDAEEEPETAAPAAPATTTATATTPEPAPVAAPAAEPTPAAAPEAAPVTPPPEAPKPAADERELARELQTPSPGGAGKARAQLVDTPEFSLALRGFAQVQVAPYVGKDALLANGDAADFAGFRARRALLGVEGRAAGTVSFGLWIDLADAIPLSQVRLAWSPLNEVAVEAGVVTVPFSKSGIQSSAELSFQERPLAVDRLVPDRQAGVAAYGVLFGGLASYRLGLFNGAAPNRLFLGNDHPGSLAAGRVAISPFGPLRPGQADLQRGDLRLELSASGLFDDAAGYTGTGYDVNLSAQFMGLSFVGEWIHDQRVPKAAPVIGPSLPAAVSRTGMLAQLSYVIWTKGLEIAARAESVDDNEGLQDAGDVNAYAVGLHWNVADLDLRVNLDWYIRQEKFGAVLDNDTLVASTQGRF